MSDIAGSVKTHAIVSIGGVRAIEVRGIYIGQSVRYSRICEDSCHCLYRGSKSSSGKRNLYRPKCQI